MACLVVQIGKSSQGAHSILFVLKSTDSIRNLIQPGNHQDSISLE